MQNLIKVYRSLFNLEKAQFLHIDHQDTIVALVYKVILQNDNSYILKICDRKNDYLREIYFLNFFTNKLLVPRILNVAEPCENHPGAILMECLPGNLLQKKDFKENLAFDVGKCLAKIHLHPLEGYGDLINLPLNQDPCISFTTKFQEGLKECQEHFSLDLMKKCEHFYDSHVNLLKSVDGACIVHRDFRPGNLMVFEGRLQGVIDWSSARASFAEEDFSLLEHEEWSLDDKSKTPFLEGYASVRPIPYYKPLVPFLRLNKAIATLGFMYKRKTWQNKCKALYQFNFNFLKKLFYDIS